MWKCQMKMVPSNSLILIQLAEVGVAGCTCPMVVGFDFAWDN